MIGERVYPETLWLAPTSWGALGKNLVMMVILPGDAPGGTSLGKLYITNPFHAMLGRCLSA
jgi:hypothetical protein